MIQQVENCRDLIKVTSSFYSPNKAYGGKCRLFMVLSLKFEHKLSDDMNYYVRAGLICCFSEDNFKYDPEGPKTGSVLDISHGQLNFGQEISTS